MLENVRAFENEDFGRVRALIINDDLWFVARDIALACGFTKSQLRHLGFLMARVPERCLSVFNITQLNTKGVKSVYPLSIVTLEGIEFFLTAKNLPCRVKFLKWLKNTIVYEMGKTAKELRGSAIKSDDKIRFTNETYDFLANLYADLGLSPKQTAYAIDRIWKKEFGYSAIEEAGLINDQKLEAN